MELVRPWVEVDVRSQQGDTTSGRRGRKLRDLVALRLTSGDLIQPSELGLEGVSDIHFFGELADKLDAAVCEGLHLGRRIGWDDKRGLWTLGGLERAYFVDPAETSEDGHEPDRFHRGIAPSVKLLSAVVTLIAAQNLRAARGIVERWLSRDNQIHIRMWAAAARSGMLVTPREAYSFLVATTPWQFWDQNAYPEIAELRAVRFSEFTATQQARMIERLLQQRPASHWPSTFAADRLREAQEFWTLRELRRIELGGGVLPQDAVQWMTPRLGSHPQIAAMSRVMERFQAGPPGGWVASTPDFRYDELAGDALLDALDEALTSGQFADANEAHTTG